MDGPEPRKAEQSTSNRCMQGKRDYHLNCMAKSDGLIDFAELPPAVKSIPHAAEGQIVVIQVADLMESRKLIPDLATWIQCFSIYAAVIITKQPEW